MLAFFVKMRYYNQARLIGQAVKTPPSHGGNRGSIPLRTVQGCQKEFWQLFHFIGNCFPMEIKNVRKQRCIRSCFRTFFFRTLFVFLFRSFPLCLLAVDRYQLQQQFYGLIHSLGSDMLIGTVAGIFRRFPGSGMAGPYN